MFNISNFTCEDHPVRRDTWTHLARQAIDCLFAINDAEACWRGWRIHREQGGLARRYRNPLFDLLIACTTCRGCGRDTGLTCITCDGTGRVAIMSVGEVN